MAENSVIISSEEAKLLKPIDEYVEEIQKKIDALRADGFDKVSDLKKQIAIAKENKNLSATQRDKIIENSKKELENAKKVEADNKEEIKKLIAEAESYLAAHYKKDYYDVVNKSCKAAKAEENSRYEKIKADLKSEHQKKVASLKDAEEIKAEKTAVNVPVTPVVENVIRFRDRFPFLNSPDCPDVLKILVADMFTAYDLYLKTFRELGELPDDVELEQAFAIAKTTVENYLEDRSIWEELEYYRDNHVLLGKHPRIAVYLASDELSNKSDLEVMNIRKNAASNVSKWKKKLETVEGEEERAKALAAVDKWESMKSAAEKELENRKKN